MRRGSWDSSGFLLLFLVLLGSAALAEQAPSPPAGTPPQVLTLLPMDHVPQPVPGKVFVDLVSPDYDKVAVSEFDADGRHETKVFRRGDGTPPAYIFTCGCSW